MASPPHPDAAQHGVDHPIPLSLYVHFPWCVKKCPYCDFNSHTRRGDIDQRGYVAALLEDLARDVEVYGSARALSSIFMGGGTPSLFGAAAIGELLQGIAVQLTFAADIEITMEANPGAVEHDEFAAYRAAGVNRLSMGAQSFDDAQLKNLGRIHSAAESMLAIRAARDAGFVNFNLDLMHGLPGQSPAAALRDLDIALDFAPRHLSLYQLTIEPRTEFYRRPPTLPGDARIMDMQRRLRARAAARGYGRYEVSAYAQPGAPCRHNLNYWQFGDYLGIGAGAHGKITAAHGIARYWKQRHPSRYVATAGTPAAAKTTRVDGADAVFELLMNGLRLSDGFAAELLPQRAACAESAMQTALNLLAPAIKRGWIKTTGGRIKCSAQGYWFLDEILQNALPESAAGDS